MGRRRFKITKEDMDLSTPDESEHELVKSVRQYRQQLSDFNNILTELKQVDGEFALNYQTDVELKKKILSKINEVVKYTPNKNMYIYLAEEFIYINNPESSSTEKVRRLILNYNQGFELYFGENTKTITCGLSNPKYDEIISQLTIKILFTTIESCYNFLKREKIPEIHLHIKEQQLLNTIMNDGTLYCPHCGEVVCGHSRKEK